MTAHGPVLGKPGDSFVALGARVDAAAISWAQRQILPEVNWFTTVHTGIDVESFPFAAGGGYLLCLGRFTPDKGAHIAIDGAAAPNGPSAGRVGGELRAGGESRAGGGRRGRARQDRRVLTLTT